MKIIKWTDLKALLQLGKDEADYSKLGVINKSAIASIESYIARYIEQDVYTETKYTETGVTPLAALPVSIITSVTQQGAALTDYYIRPAGIEIYDADPDYPVTIVYTGGFDDIPTDIYRAVLLQTAYEWQNSDHIGATFVSTEGGTVQRPALGLLPEVKNLLSSYIHPAKGIY